MLIWFAVENWKCFRDRQELSMEIVGQVEDEFAFDTGAKRYPRLNRVSAVYGPNGSGKSVLVETLAFMRGFVLRSAEDQAGEPINVEPFLFDARTREEPACFEIGFIREGSVYEYGFAIDAERVREEWLHVWPPGGRLQRWLDREFDPSSGECEWRFSPLLRGQRAVWRKATRPNALFVSTAARLNSEALAPVIRWFSDLQILGAEGEGLRRQFTSDRLRREPGFKERVLDLLHRTDIPVSDIRIDEEHLRTGGGEFGFRVEGSDELAWLPFEEEGGGIMRMYEFAGLWLDAIDRGRVLVADDLDRSLHPHLARFLVGLINRIGRKDGQRAQLVATVHDPMLLDRALDSNQVWLAEKHRDQSASLTALSDYRVRPDESLFRGYLGGRYNAVPNVADPEMFA